MKVLHKGLLISILATSIFAQDKISCVTHAQCQNLVDESTGCFLVQKDEDKKKCEVKCFRVFIGSYCNFEESKPYGTCEVEDYKNASVDEKKPDCSKALPKSVVENLFEI